MSYPNGRKVWSIVYRWPRYFGLNHNHHVIDESKWFWRFGILKMSYLNGQKVWSIVYRWPRCFGRGGQNPRETSIMLQTWWVSKWPNIFFLPRLIMVSRPQKTDNFFLGHFDPPWPPPGGGVKMASITIIYQHVIDDSKLISSFGILKMSYPNGRKVRSIVYRWPRYFRPSSRKHFFSFWPGKMAKNPKKYSKQLSFYCCYTHFFSFPRKSRFRHPRRHTGPRKNTFFGFQTRENTYRSEKQF